MTADLPRSFVRLPGGGRNFDTLTTCTGSGVTREIELVVLINPLNQDNPEPNFDATIAMMDEVEAVIPSLKSTMSMINWTISSGLETVGRMDYWAVVAAIEGTD
jgi:hypothetical protein